MKIEKVELSKKEILRNHLISEFQFSHRIDVEPTPQYPICQEELTQIFRTILFNINKTHLRSKYFSKWSPDRKFWIVGCRQGGDGQGSEKHYHLLLHTPDDHELSVFTDFYWGFAKYAGVNPSNGKRRPLWKNYRDKNHNGADELDTKCLINVESVKNQTGSIKYNTRLLKPNLDGDDLFVIGIKE